MRSTLAFQLSDKSENLVVFASLAKIGMMDFFAVTNYGILALTMVATQEHSMDAEELCQHLFACPGLKA
jgi:hypothetical protein